MQLEDLEYRENHAKEKRAVESYRNKKKQKELDAQRKLDVEMEATCTDSQIEETPVKSKEGKDTARLDGLRVNLTLTIHTHAFTHTRL